MLCPTAVAVVSVGLTHSTRETMILLGGGFLIWGFCHSPHISGTNSPMAPQESSPIQAASEVPGSDHLTPRPPWQRQQWVFRYELCQYWDIKQQGWHLEQKEKRIKCQLQLRRGSVRSSHRWEALHWMTVTSGFAHFIALASLKFVTCSFLRIRHLKPRALQKREGEGKKLLADDVRG